MRARENDVRPLPNTHVRRLAGALAAAAVLTAASPAAAARFLYQLTGNRTASFTLDAEPTVVESGVAYFRVDGVNAFTEDGSGFAHLYFYTQASSGGFTLTFDPDGPSYLETQGATLFEGTLDHPVMSPGTFALTDYDGPGTYRLKVTELGGVPEPTTWTGLSLGFLATGVAMRGRRTRNPKAA